MINSNIKLMLVEDHKLMRVGLKSLFEEQEGLEVTSEANNGHDAVEKFKTTHPDVTLMDIGLPDISGIEATKKILELTKGSIIELENKTAEPIDLLVNGKLIGKGEVVIIEDNFGLRITDTVEEGLKIHE